MSNLKFYIVFSIFNILLTIFIAGSIFGALFLMFYDLFNTPDIIFCCGVTVYIIFFYHKITTPKVIYICDK